MKDQSAEPNLSRSDAPFECSRELKILAIVIFVVVAYFWWVTPNHPLYVADSIYYVSGAQSIAQGAGYRCLVLEGHPATGYYPPLQSLYLSTAWLFNANFPENQIVLKCLMIAIWAATLCGFFILLRKGGLARGYTALLTLSVGTSGIWAYFVIHCFSDILFSLLAFSVMYIWLGESPAKLNHKLTLTGIILALMYLTRIATFGFLPGAVIAAAVSSFRLRTPKPVVFLGLPVLIAMGAWALAPKETYSYGTYYANEIRLHGGTWAWIQDLVSYCFYQSWDYFNGKHLLQNLSTDLTSLLDAVAPTSFIWKAGVQLLLPILGMFFWLLVCYGAFRSPKDRPLQAAVITYLMQLLVWPFPLGFRGLLPLLPLLIIWSVRGAKALPSQWFKVCRTTAAVYLLICLLSNFSGAAETRRSLDQSDKQGEAEAAGEWIRNSIPPTSRLASNFTLPMMHVWQMSGHPIVIVEGLSKALHDNELKLDYILTASRFPRDQNIGDKSGTQLKVIWESSHGGFQILQVIAAN